MTTRAAAVIKKHFAFFLLIAIGCTPPVHSGVTQQITVAPAAEKTICIQKDPTKSEMVLITKPLEAELVAKGYRVVEAPGQAAYTLRLDVVWFGLTGRPRPSSGSAAAAGNAIGTAAGSAASGSVLHTTSAAGTAGGLIGFGAGAVLGMFSGSSPRVLFVGNIDVSITDSSKKKEKTLVSAWTRVFRDNEEINAREGVAKKLAVKIAGLMP
jgi:hypothetical protein